LKKNALSPRNRPGKTNVSRGHSFSSAIDFQALTRRHRSPPGQAARRAPFAGGAASSAPIIEKRSRAHRSCTRDPPRSVTPVLQKMSETTVGDLTEGRRRASSAGLWRPSESAHRRGTAGQRSMEPGVGQHGLVHWVRPLN
jgi:hypothetical protein